MEGQNCGLGEFAGPLICGVDEAGRGPLAGPVVAAAVILADDFDTAGIHDSKTLSPVRRAVQRKRIIQSQSLWGIGIVNHAMVDRINVLQASLLAMKKAVENLPVTPEIILVDGRFEIPDLGIRQKTIVDGDESEAAISAASILAKTSRDEIMIVLDGKYPEYGFRKHKGYPTKEHIANLNRLGPCPVHRRSFRPVLRFFCD
jgi:ribonuclease HII